MKLLLKFCILVLLPIVSNATVQIPEKIIIGDGVFNFYRNYPFDTLISKKDFYELYEIETGCSAAWRGYQGTWEIKDNKLLLVRLRKDPCNFDLKEIEHFDLMKVISNFNVRKRGHKASWYSGEIVIPISEVRLIPQKKNKFGESYKEHQVIVYLINNGNVSSREILYREYKKI